MSIRFGSNRRPKSVEHKWIVIGVPDHIADNSSVIQIKDGAEIYLLYFNSDIVFEFCDIGQPLLVGLICLEFSVQQVICQIIRILSLPGAAVVAVFNRGFNPTTPADPQHPLVIYMGAMVSIQLVFEPAVSHLRVFFVDIFYQIGNTFILSYSGGQFACRPPVIGCPGNLQ
jgi:hypothetical protein